MTVLGAMLGIAGQHGWLPRALGAPCRWGKEGSKAHAAAPNLGMSKKRFKVTTDSNHELQISPNQLNREFTVAEPDRV